MSQTKAQLIDAVDGSIVTADIADGAINNAKVNASAAIARTKLANVDLVDDTSPQLGGALDTNNQNIEFGDVGNTSQNRLKFGASGDFSIFHDASNSKNFISSIGSNDLSITSRRVDIKNDVDSETLASFIKDGAVELYYDNSKKFETTSYGNLSAAQIRVAASNATTVGFSVGDVGTGFYNAGSNAIGYSANGTQKWLINSSGDLRLTDDVKGTFGNDDDLQISHSSTFNNSLILNNTNDLFFRSGTAIYFQNTGGTENYAKFVENGAVELYYNNSKKFETHDIGTIFTQASSGVNNGALKINTTMDTYGSIIVRNQSHSNTTIGALEVENNSNGTNETNFVIRSVNLGSTHWSHAWYAAKSHRFAVEANVTGTPKVQVDLDGLKFNGDQASANALDDYEEGSFTPGSNATLTTAAGFYTKIGRQVTLHIRITVASQSSGSPFEVNGFPFTAGMSGTTSNGAVPNGFGYISSGSVIPQIHHIHDGTKAQFYNFNNFLTISNVSGKEYRFGLIYYTA